MPLKHHYTALGLSPLATPAQVQLAYRRLARKYHPDVSQENNAEAHFKDVAQAYVALRQAQPQAASRAPFPGTASMMASHTAMLDLWLTPWVMAWDLGWASVKAAVPAPR